MILRCMAWLAAAVTPLAAQETVWAPKARVLPPYTAPHRPHVRLADLKARHAGRAEWRELVMDDEHLRAEYVSAASGSRVTRRFHPDTRAWWVVLDGEIRFDIEGAPPFVAKKGWMVQAPPQTMYALEITGERPALRLEVHVAKAKTLFPKEASPPALPGFDWVQVRMPRRPLPFDERNRPYRPFEEVASQAKYDARGLSVTPIVADDRGAMNFIYGYEKNLAPLDPKDPGTGWSSPGMRLRVRAGVPLSRSKIFRRRAGVPHFAERYLLKDQGNVKKAS